MKGYSSFYAPFLKLLQNNNQRLPRAAQPTLSPHHESCCDKLCRWLSTAIRQHTVSLTKCFLSDTLELLWLLAAWFQVFILRFARRLRHHQRWLLPPLRPRHRGHMARHCWWGGCSWITDSLCWRHVGAQWWSTPLSSIYQTEAILCHVGICWYVSSRNGW